MKLFKCQACGQLLYFENDRCTRCSRSLGYLPLETTLSALEPEGEAWQAWGGSGGVYRFCENSKRGVCNWVIPNRSHETFCLACRHNRTIPDLTAEENFARWRRLEAAKHRLFYTILRLKLPLSNRVDDPDRGLAFDFIDSGPAPTAGSVVTGHSNGVITVALKEADDVERERERRELGETYRTELGHLRHEIGHYYWDRLVKDQVLESFRARFGDERVDYAAALERHYSAGPPPDWREAFVSAYASAHPWEDFAETWAHYLHIVDGLETASSFGLRVQPGIDDAGVLHAQVDFDPHRATSIAQLIDAWLPVTFAVNSLNRSMGQRDLYPFFLSPPVVEKLGMIHELMRAAREDRALVRRC